MFRGCSEGVQGVFRGCTRGVQGVFVGGIVPATSIKKPVLKAPMVSALEATSMM